MAYGVFKNNLYRISDNQNGKIDLISDKKENGFHEYVNIIGEKNNKLFVKLISENDLEDAYELWQDVIYKGERFELVNYVETLLDGEPVTIATSDAAKAKKFGFTHVDHAVYEKEIPISDIEAIIEIKEPLYQFEETKATTTRTIPRDEIMDYVRYIASFA